MCIILQLKQLQKNILWVLQLKQLQNNLYYFTTKITSRTSKGITVIYN